MDTRIKLTPVQMREFLLDVALVRPVFLWGAPGIGKSSIVESFAEELELPCVSLLGSQLAPEDLIGVPQIIDGISRFCPPSMIVRKEPFVLFLDELNASSPEIMKAFYSLIHERRIGEYRLPEGSIIIGAGNRAQDSAIVKQMPAPLINRMVHVEMKVSHRDWLDWAYANGVHDYVTSFIQERPDYLWAQPPKTEEPFSTPRSWHMLSDALKGCAGEPSDARIEVLASGCLTPAHAVQFRSFIKKLRNQYDLDSILKGEKKWPAGADMTDVLYFLVQSFRARMLRELPHEENRLTDRQRQFAHTAKGLLKDLAAISLEMAQMAAERSDEGQTLPGWFMSQVVRDLPRLAMRKEKAGAQTP